MTKAYINALSEGSKQEMLEWIVKLDAENEKLRADLAKATANHTADLSVRSESAASSLDAEDAARYRKLRDELIRGDRASGYLPENLHRVTNQMDFDQAVDEGWR